VPSAVHAAYADRCTEGDDDWQTSGDDIYHDVGNVGIGTTTPGVPLDVVAAGAPAARFEGGSGTLNFTVRGHNDVGTAGAFFSAAEPNAYPPIPAGVAGMGGTASLGGYFYSYGHHALLAASPNGRAIWGVSDYDYAGYFGGGGQGVYVEDQLETNEFKMQPGAGSGYVLTSDVNGVGSWQPGGGGSDSDWTISGTNMYATPTGNVGIGTVTPGVKLDVVTGDATSARFDNNSGTLNFTVSAHNSGGTAGGFFAGSSPGSYPGVPVAVFGAGGAGYRGAHFTSLDDIAVFASSSTGVAIRGNASVSYAGYFAGGGAGVYVEDQLETNEFKMQPGAASGYVLTSDVNGTGSWQPAGTGGDSDWTISGSNMYATPSGNVGIGEIAPTAKLEVEATGTSEALYVKHAGATGVGRMVNIERTVAPGAGNDILQIKVPAGSPDSFQFIEAENGGVNKFVVDGDGHVTARRGGEFSSSLLDGGVPVLSGVSTASGYDDVVGVYGESVPVAGYGVGGSFVGGYRGVRGTVNPTLSGHFRGVSGLVSGGTGYNYGVYGSADGGAVNYGVYGTTPGPGYAGYFSGATHVNGTFTATVKSFKIDHPLDPENKYLVHSCVESDEMMNIYNGNATLDARGEATVEMPDWFEALNQDFRYQLTCIGGFAPVYVAETVRDGRFMIAGGEPGMVISWQVTGVRHDPIALASRMAVEQDKPANEVGKYMNPEVYGMPLTAGIDYHEEREMAVSSGLTVAFDPNDGE